MFKKSKKQTTKYTEKNRKVKKIIKVDKRRWVENNTDKWSRSTSAKRSITLLSIVGKYIGEDTHGQDKMWNWLSAKELRNEHLTSLDIVKYLYKWQATLWVL